MKTRSIIAAAAVFAFAGAAFAQGEATYEYPQAVNSAKSRADVKAELFAARAAGQVVSGEAGYEAASKGRAPVRSASFVAAAGDRLPLNVEAISFDGRSVAQRAQVPATASVLAQASK